MLWGGSATAIGPQSMLGAGVATGLVVDAAERLPRGLPGPDVVDGVGRRLGFSVGWNEGRRADEQPASAAMIGTSARAIEADRGEITVPMSLAPHGPARAPATDAPGPCGVELCSSSLC